MRLQAAINSSSFCLLFRGQDGGLLINNPTALAIHESKCLWPSTPLECVVSVGTGRVENLGKNSTTSTSLKTKLSHVISSATDTEGKTRFSVKAALLPHYGANPRFFFSYFTIN